MAYVDKNQERNILDEVVISKFENLPILLEIISKNPHITQSDLMRKSKYSGGKIYHCIKALKAMKLVENGNGLKITNLGRDFIVNYGHKEYFEDILKMACLNVPLFKKIYNQNNKLAEPKKLFDIFQKEINPNFENTDPKFIGAVVRRYLRGVHRIKLRVGYKLRPKDLEGKFQNTEKTKIKKDGEEIINSLQNLKKKLNLSDKEFNQFINGLPEKKREEVFSKILLKVFN